MNRNPLTLFTGVVLVIIFVLLLFTFQVRQTEVAVVTTFGRYSKSITSPGFNLKWPWPIQRVYKFENRTQSFEKKFEQTQTGDSRIILITVYAGWKISDPQKFLIRFDGDPLRAEQSLENLIRNAQNSVIGRHQFGDLVSPNPADLKFDQVEKEMLVEVKDTANKEYGIDITLLGIKQLGLPESITTKVFERMKEERARLVTKFNSEGEEQATIIRAEANRKRQEILSKAEAESLVIMGQGEAEASKSMRVFEQNRELAVFLLQLNALEQSLKERATLILDAQSAPFNMLNGVSAENTKSKSGQ
ncbi:MAG: protease modulator HflC [Verrucomicrobiota bacterium]